MFTFEVLINFQTFSKNIYQATVEFYEQRNAYIVYSLGYSVSGVR